MQEDVREQNGVGVNWATFEHTCAESVDRVEEDSVVVGTRRRFRTRG